MPNTRRDERIRFDNMAGVAMSRLEVYSYTDGLGELHDNDELFEVFRNMNLVVNRDDKKEGGSGVVYGCNGGSVLKVSSFRYSYTSDGLGATLFDVKNSPQTNDEKMQKEFLGLRLEAEALTNRWVRDDIREKLVDPFVVAVCVNTEVVDYLICVNMPRYEEAGGRFRIYNEEEILIMIRDVLMCLEQAHNDGIRHGDIKPTNIMYNGSSYVLIDWGSSGVPAVNRLTQMAYGARANGAYTPYFVNPRLYNDRNETSPEIDLYSLGVIMAYLAHPEGYLARRKVEEFRDIVCNNAFEGNNPIIAADIYSGLANSSDEFKDIVRRAMDTGGEHSYKTAANMGKDVEKLLNKILAAGGKNNGKDGAGEDANIKKKAAKKNAGLIITPWYGLIFALALIAVTLIASGIEGFVTEYIAKGEKVGVYLSVLWCGILPFINILYSNRKNKRMVWKITVSRSLFIEGAAMCFLGIAVSTAVLKFLNETVTIDMNAGMFAGIHAVMSVTSLIPAFNRCGKERRMIISSIIVGICTGSGIAMYICGWDIGEMMSLPMLGMVGSVILFCFVCGTVAAYIYWLCSTRAVRLKR